MRQPSTGALVPEPEASLHPEHSRNTVIEGDNLEVEVADRLRGHHQVDLHRPALQHRSRVHLPRQLSRRARAPDSAPVDAEGARTTCHRQHRPGAPLAVVHVPPIAADPARRRTIAVSIDDHEVHNLRCSCGVVRCRKLRRQPGVAEGLRGQHDRPVISATHDHILVYARDATRAVVATRAPKPSEPSSPTPTTTRGGLETRKPVGRPFCQGFATTPSGRSPPHHPVATGGATKPATRRGWLTDASGSASTAAAAPCSKSS